VGEGGDEVSVARFIADQRTEHQVPHAFTCRVLGVSASWFYKWLNRPPTARQARRAELDAAVKQVFEGSKGTYGSPRVHAELIAAAPATGGPDAPPARVWKVSVNTVADSMRRQGLLGRKPKRRKGLTRQDRTAPKFPDLVKRDFTAPAPNRRWVGDMTEIPTDEGKLYLATVLDLYSRRLLSAPTSEHPDAQLACDSIKMATATRGGREAIPGVVFHTDRGSTYTAGDFTSLCTILGIDQSMGRVGSCFDNAAAESFFSTLEWEVLSRHHFATREQARQVVTAWAYEFYNTRRRHSSADMMSPIDYENSATVLPDAA
jgi:putative transposase